MIIPQHNHTSHTFTVFLFYQQTLKMEHFSQERINRLGNPEHVVHVTYPDHPENQWYCFEVSRQIATMYWC